MPTCIRAWPHPRDSANLSSARKEEEEEEEEEEKEEEAIPTKAAQRHSSYGRLFHMLNVLCPVKRTVEIRTSEAWYWIKRLVIKDAAVSKDRGIIFVFSPWPSSRVTQETRKFERVIFKRHFSTHCNTTQRSKSTLKLQRIIWPTYIPNNIRFLSATNELYKRCQHSADCFMKVPPTDINFPTHRLLMITRLHPIPTVSRPRCAAITAYF